MYNRQQNWLGRALVSCDVRNSPRLDGKCEWTVLTRDQTRDWGDSDGTGKLKKKNEKSTETRSDASQGLPHAAHTALSPGPVDASADQDV